MGARRGRCWWRTRSREGSCVDQHHAPVSVWRRGRGWQCTGGDRKCRVRAGDRGGGELATVAVQFADNLSQVRDHHNAHDAEAGVRARQPSRAHRPATAVGWRGVATNDRRSTACGQCPPPRGLRSAFRIEGPHAVAGRRQQKKTRASLPKQHRGSKSGRDGPQCVAGGGGGPCVAGMNCGWQGAGGKGRIGPPTRAVDGSIFGEV